MKKMENSFVVSGFVGKDASIHQFSTASVARFPLAISRTEKSGEETTRTSAFINVETWRKNENTLHPLTALSKEHSSRLKAISSRRSGRMPTVSSATEWHL